MKIDILTIFPEMFSSPFAESMLKRAQKKRIVEIKIHNLRDWSTDKYRSVDDSPFGGGAGMVMRVDVVDRALTDLKAKSLPLKAKVILLDTKGRLYDQQKAQELTKVEHLILIAGHYEGIDHRVHKHLADEVISIGEYVLTGGEIPVMVIVDSVVRLLPGVLGNPESLSEESYSLSKSYIEYPQYTRPPEYKGWKVPEVLLSGDPKKIKQWQEEKTK
ncbi:tRNA (guanosine(37)-N1)-methyltransferase TrmD [Candidatus Beckwithbacteria bacterium RBG_13_42_9]|uniref:tRNA (guanine-N(1)-)-methyltransferase n=1 Tax=Candidatus Beckwithbacteria bacterium RBG_13_42_9 TaxID=1797457 RepID=A0A1F5E7U4_9BACT|nr:MAG: tRNA (guanosine(37)-N1)-methyltransferase TrmD [Candidatus Beckwithbacteria bacterium RBG_13_42_9]